MRWEEGRIVLLFIRRSTRAASPTLAPHYDLQRESIPCTFAELPDLITLWVVSRQETFVVAVRFTVNLVELRRACRPSLSRLSDESEIGTDFAMLNATGRALKISTGNSSEVLAATIHRSGQATVPRLVFCCLVRALRYCRGRSIDFEFSPGTIMISGRTLIRHSGVAVANSNPKISGSERLE